MQFPSFIIMLLVAALTVAACEENDSENARLASEATAETDTGADPGGSKFDHEFTVDIVDGQPEGDVATFTVATGDSYRITITSDSRQVVHFDANPDQGSDSPQDQPVTPPVSGDPEDPIGSEERENQMEGPDFVTVEPGKPGSFSVGGSPFEGRFVLETLDPAFPLAVVVVS